MYREYFSPLTTAGPRSQGGLHPTQRCSGLTGVRARPFIQEEFSIVSLEFQKSGKNISLTNALSNSRLRTPGVSLGVKASEGWEGFLLVLHFKCHGRKPVGIYQRTIGAWLLIFFIPKFRD